MDIKVGLSRIIFIQTSTFVTPLLYYGNAILYVLHLVMTSVAWWVSAQLGGNRCRFTSHIGIQTFLISAIQGILGWSQCIYLFSLSTPRILLGGRTFSAIRPQVFRVKT